jgi:hypothetical protein
MKDQAFRSLLFSLSVTAHGALLLMAGGGGDMSQPNRGGALLKGATSRVVDVQLITSSNEVENQQENAPIKEGERQGAVSASDTTTTTSASDGATFSLTEEILDRYYPVRELSQKPEVLHNISPELSLQLSEGQSRIIVLRLLISKVGTIDEVVPLDTSIPQTMIDLIGTTFKGLVFKPGEINGIPVKAQLDIEVFLENPDDEKKEGR